MRNEDINKRIERVKVKGKQKLFARLAWRRIK